MYHNILLASDLIKENHAIALKAKQLADDFSAPTTEDAKLVLATLGEELSIPEAHQIVSFGSVKHEVLSAADNLKIDLIVLGSHSFHGLSHLLGSTTNAILNHAKCDVLTVRINT